MSREAYQARLSNLVGVNRKRTYAESRRLELEIALGTHRGENYRAMARCLGCSHVYCYKVARQYRAGLIPLLPRDEQGLVEFRDSLDREARYRIPLSEVARGIVDRATDAAEQRKNPALDGRPRTIQEWPEQGCEQYPDTDVDEQQPGPAALREQSSAAPGFQPSNPYRVMAHAKTLREWQERRGGRRVMSSVPPWLRPTPKLDFGD